MKRNLGGLFKSKVGNITLTLLLCLTCILPCWANDGQYYVSGNQLIPLKQNKIAVAKEVLKINIGTDGYADVDVHYVFDNKAEQQSIVMGFEADLYYVFNMEFDSAMTEHPFIEDFTVELNGMRLPYNCAMVLDEMPLDEEGNILPVDWNEWELYDGNMLLKRGGSDDDDENLALFSFAYYFDATFKPGVNVLHHHYRYKMSVSVVSNYGLDYKLSPAMRWANGQIDDFTLEISAENTVCDFFLTGNPFGDQEPEIKGTGKFRMAPRWDFDEAEEAMEVVLRNASIVFHVENFQPETELSIESAVSPVFLYYGFSEDLNPETFRYEPTSYGYGDMEPEHIAEMSQTERHIVRNLPYAARGHVFKNKELADFFTRCWWYMPDPTGKDEHAIPMTEDELKIVKVYQK